MEKLEQKRFNNLVAQKIEESGCGCASVIAVKKRMLGVCCLSINVSIADV